MPKAVEVKQGPKQSYTKGNEPSEKAKAQGRIRRSTPVVSPETYQRMYAAYLERQSAAHVSRVTGVAETTALKYIEKGHPKRGMDPLRDRFKRIQDMTRQQQDYDQAQAWAEFQKAGRAAFMKVVQRIQSMDPEELEANKIPEHLNKLMTLIERTMGGAEHTHEIKGQFATWNIAELRAYLEDGIVPEK